MLRTGDTTMNMNKRLYGAIGAVLFFSSYSMAAGIPVFDGIQNTESINQFVQKLQQWSDTVTHYQNELDAYKKQLATATGVRNIQSFLSDAKNLKNDLDNLRKNGVSLDDLLTNSGGSYSSQLDSLYSKYKSLSTRDCDSSVNTSQLYQDTCKQIVLNQAVAVENTSEVQDKISDTLSDISTLSSRMELSEDSKESQDLANAISAKSVQLNALTAQWEMSVKQSEIRNQMLAQKKQKAFTEQQMNAPVPDLNNL